MTVVNLANYKHCLRPQPIEPSPSTGLNSVDIVRATYESIRITDGQEAATLAAQEMMAAACMILRRDEGREIALDTLFMCAASTR